LVAPSLPPSLPPFLVTRRFVLFAVGREGKRERGRGREEEEEKTTDV
jgi:hypothetical protein